MWERVTDGEVRLDILLCECIGEGKVMEKERVRPRAGEESMSKSSLRGDGDVKATNETNKTHEQVPSGSHGSLFS